MSILPTSKINWNRLLKRDFLWLANHRCTHGNRYIEHISCYLREKPLLDDAPVVERIGFLDIETSNLNADFGYIISWCIKVLDGEIIESILTPEDINTHTFDKRIISELCSLMRTFDRLVVYYGKDYRFDVPYVRTRALHHGIDFPGHKELVITDLFDVVKKKLRLHRNRLATACDFLDIPAKGHTLNPTIWQKAMSGDKASLDWILEHNREDVISTELLWKRLEKFSPNSNTSI